MPCPARAPARGRHRATETSRIPSRSRRASTIARSRRRRVRQRGRRNGAWTRRPASASSSPLRRSAGCRQLRAQPVQTAMQPRLHGAGRDPEGRRGLRLRQLQQIPERDDRALSSRSRSSAARTSSRVSPARPAPPPIRRRRHRSRPGLRRWHGLPGPPVDPRRVGGSVPRWQRSGGARVARVRLPGTARVPDRPSRTPPVSRPQPRVQTGGGATRRGTQQPGAAPRAPHTRRRHRPGRAR